MDNYIKSDASIQIGSNIRKIRLKKNIKQIELVKELQLQGFNITKETIVKLEHGKRHIKASEFKVIRQILNTTYDELLQ